MRGTRFGVTGFDGNDVFRQLAQRRQQLLGGWQSHQKPTGQAALEVCKGIGAVDLVALLQGIESVRRQDTQGVQIIGQYFGGEILLRRQPRYAGGVLQGQTMLESLEGFLDAPAAVVEGGEIGGGIGRVIEQRSHQDVEAPVGCHHLYQTDGRRCLLAFIIGTVTGIWRANRDDLLGQIGTEKGIDGGKPGLIDAQTETNALLRQVGDQPARRIAPIEHQQVVGRQRLQMLEQHLPLADIGRIQGRRQRHLQTGQIEGKGDHLTDAATAGIAEKQLHFRSIGCYHAQAVPTWHRHLVGDQPQKVFVETGKGAMRKLAARLGKGLRTDQADEIGLIGKMGEERVQFILNAGLETGEHDRQQHWKGQGTLAAEGVRAKTALVEEFCGMQDFAKVE